MLTGGEESDGNGERRLLRLAGARVGDLRRGNRNIASYPRRSRLTLDGVLGNGSVRGVYAHGKALEARHDG